jgi:nucleoside-diphosphate-sugar epimerase
MKVLVVGGTRFIGPHIIRKLREAGHQVLALNRGKSPTPLPPDVLRLTCDKNDRDRFRAALLDAAPDAVVDTCLGADDLEFACAALSGRIRQFVHTGSTGVYTPMRRLPAREEDAIRIVPGITFEDKWTQDQVLLRWRDERGFPATIIRPTNVFGPGAVPLDLWGSRTPAFFQRLADGRPVTLPNDGRTLIQPVDVEDLASAYVLALATKQSIGQVYNVSRWRALTHAEYLSVIMDLLRSRSPVEYLPMEELIRLHPDAVNVPAFRFHCEHMFADISKAHRELGYDPQVSVEEGMRRSLRWMAEKGQLRTEEPL